MALLATVAAGRVFAQGGASVVTYHNDNARTGANSSETILTPANVNASSFGAITTVALDDFSNTQPLVVNDAAISSFAPNGAVYVGTDNNTIYAIDAVNGSILTQRNLGAPVPTKWSCTGTNLGIFGTPTIDLTSRRLYVMVNTLLGGVPAYQLHALDLQTFADAPGSPVTIQATKVLQDGSTYTFDADVQRQRSAMLESNGVIYVAFGSQCDADEGISRGWVLGWDAATLTPLAGAEVTNVLGASVSDPCGSIWLPAPCYLSSIWMSGYGPAADAAGNIYFVTSNSAQDSYDPVFNAAESAVKISGDLSQKLDLFTPSNQPDLDSTDKDFGSGGIMLLPDQGGQFPPLAVAAGKDGRMFVLNRNSMGGFQNPDIPNNVSIGGCWCGPSYLQTATGGFVVSSGGKTVELWSPVLISGAPGLSLSATAASQIEANTQSAGFFTSISSNGTTPDTGIIWALGRAAGPDLHITLYAYSATPSGSTLPLLWSGVAGRWPAIPKRHNINAVPTVANGHVYVASYQKLQIFGLVSPASTTTTTTVTAAPASIAPTGSTTLTASVNAVTGSATPTGNVAFTTGTASLGVSTLTGSGTTATAAITVNGSVFPLSSNTVTATYNPVGIFTGSAGATSVSVTQGASRLIFSTQPPGNATPGTPFGAAVQLQDVNGNLVNASGVPVTIGTTSTGIGGTLTANTVNGVATFGNLFFAAAGSYRLTASASGLTSAVSNSVAISGQIATQLVFRAQPPATAAKGTAVVASVQIDDAGGNLVSTSSATVTIGSSPAGVSGTITVNAVTGVAVFTNLVFNGPGTYVLTASSPGLSGATSNSIQIPAAGQTITFSAPANVTFGAAPFPLAATATSGLTVTFVSNTTSVCAVSGNILRIGTAGTCTVTAMQSGNSVYPAAPSVTQSFTIAKATPVVNWTQPAPITAGTALSAAQLNATANVPGTFVYAPPAGTQLPVGSGQALNVTFTPADSTDYATAGRSTTIEVDAMSSAPPAKLIFSTLPPKNGAAGTPFGAVVQLQDVNGNPVNLSGVSVTIGTTTTGISGTLTANTVNGVATFGNLVFTAAGSYRLTASASGLTSAVSSIVVITGQSATQLVFRGQPPATAVTGTPVYASVQIDDAGGNPVRTSSAPVTIVSSPPGLGGTVSVNAVTGVAVFDNLVFNSPGSYVLTASSPGLTGITSNTIVISAAGPN